MTDIYWGQALVQLAGLQVVALGLVGLIAAVRWFRARTRSLSLRRMLAHRG